MAKAIPSDAAEALAAQGRTLDAMMLLNRLVAAGDAEAMYTLATWRLEGRLVPRDLAAARELFGRAGEAGLGDGAMVHMNFVANGTGGPSDFAAARALLRAAAERDPRYRDQLATVEAMELTGAGDPVVVPAGERLSESPQVALFPGLFSRAECAYLIAAAKPRFGPSFVVDNQGRHVRHPTRTSDFASFPWSLEDLAVHALNRRIAAASGTRVTQGEPLQILHYRKGQQYRPHIDAVPGLDNQRELTALVYLNHDFQGGETAFLKSGLELKPRRGDAILFRNIRDDGTPDETALHAGLPVAKGVKIIASRWIRARALAPTDHQPAR